MNKPYFCRNVFLTDWRYKRLKNTIDLMLFYGEHFFEFLESVLGLLNYVLNSNAYLLPCYFKVTFYPQKFL